MAAANNLSRGNPDGTSLGQSASDKISFFGVTPVVQPSGATQATLTATWVAISSGFGFFSSDQAISVIAAIKAIQSCLTVLGLWKGSA